MKLSEKLEHLLDRDGGSKADVARDAGVGKTSCYRWFDGKAYPDILEAFRLAVLFNVDLNWLADEEAGWPPPPTELPEDENAILELYRALRDKREINKKEALARLSTPSPKEVAEPATIAKWAAGPRGEHEWADSDARRLQEKQMEEGRASEQKEETQRKARETHAPKKRK